jgi:hypothetical protein
VHVRSESLLVGIVARLAWVRNGNGDKMRVYGVSINYTWPTLLAPRFAPGAKHYIRMYMYMNGAHVCVLLLKCKTK